MAMSNGYANKFLFRGEAYLLEWEVLAFGVGDWPLRTSASVRERP